MAGCQIISSSGTAYFDDFRVYAGDKVPQTPFILINGNNYEEVRLVNEKGLQKSTYTGDYFDNVYDSGKLTGSLDSNMWQTTYGSVAYSNLESHDNNSGCLKISATDTFFDHNFSSTKKNMSI